MKRWLILVSLLVGMATWTGWAWLQHYLDAPLNIQEAGYSLVLEPGMGSALLAQRLRDDGVLGHPQVLRRYLQLSGRDTGLQAGEYSIESGTSALDLVNMLEQGLVVSHDFTIPEGWTFQGFRSRLDALPEIRHETTGLSNSELMELLGHPDQHPEGRFFPDTYRYTAKSSDTELLQRAYARMAVILDEEWARRGEALPYANAYEALTMASIVERETGIEAERTRIAGVFVRRLQLGMRLQTDPTVAYGLGDRYRGNLTRAHLREATPYNTYLISGLPPTPIALPGREAIHAALHPAPGKDLYFVARGDGSHEFSETLAQHSAAVKKYQLRRREDYRSSPPPQTTDKD